MLAGERDTDPLRTTTSLIDFLADLTDVSSRNPVRDITDGSSRAPDPVLWLDDLPDGVTFHPDAADVLLQMRPVQRIPAPMPPADLAGWVHPPEPPGPGEPEPEFRVPADRAEEEAEPLKPVFLRWLARWRVWTEDERRRQRRRRFYDALEAAAKRIEQLDDEYEFVLGVGLVCWQAPDGQIIRRHLLTEQAVPSLDRTGVVTVRMLVGQRRLEDRELFEGQEVYRPDRGRAHKSTIVENDSPALGPHTMAALREWLGLALDLACEEETGNPTGAPGTTPTFAAAPALLLRPRSRVQIRDAYRHIAEALRQPGAPIPVALSQIVVDTNREQRERWLTGQGADPGDVLGTDPLFPLPANAEQTRVIELMRTETGVVVQGPPGTGKTHTIANLISALLARGQRVLVTSQKDQALKVLRERIPPEIRKLCVLLTGGSKNASIELQLSLDALSAALATTNEAELSDQSRAYSAERDRLRATSASLNDRIRSLREVELVKHKPVVPGYSTEAYRGTLAEIVHEVRRGADEHGWMPPVPDNDQVREVPPLSTEQFAELIRLLSTASPDRSARAEQCIPGPDQLPPTSELANLIQVEHTAREIASQADDGRAAALRSRTRREAHTPPPRPPSPATRPRSSTSPATARTGRSPPGGAPARASCRTLALDRLVQLTQPGEPRGRRQSPLQALEVVRDGERGGTQLLVGHGVRPGTDVRPHPPDPLTQLADVRRRARSLLELLDRPLDDPGEVAAVLGLLRRLWKASTQRETGRDRDGHHGPFDRDHRSLRSRRLARGGGSERDIAPCGAAHQRHTARRHLPQRGGKLSFVDTVAVHPGHDHRLTGLGDVEAVGGHAGQHHVRGPDLNPGACPARPGLLVEDDLPYRVPRHRPLPDHHSFRRDPQRVDLRDEDPDRPGRSADQQRGTDRRDPALTGQHTDRADREHDTQYENDSQQEEQQSPSRERPEGPIAPKHQIHLES
ncbi:AAA domain-containing protein [Amycolatopsis suaedae]|uniref:DNA2/NAM7 helicase helicase domain-containing protein n=1 Tax=Amycolatopsis suaedae TaxID=2510978 RepID=A0A4Q7J1L2_9PSEU|nr:AAA domain-containing protein [Amycolatopsis suaedae]RZQ61280.1 hypothetical protein EWH70_25800 [Amycolatopsis suaedae]